MNGHKISIRFYWTLIALFYLGYISIFFGVYRFDPKYLRLLSTFMHLFICLFLIWRFHPFREHTLRPNDGQIIFGSALLILTNVITTELGLSHDTTKTISKVANLTELEVLASVL